MLYTGVPHRMPRGSLRPHTKILSGRCKHARSSWRSKIDCDQLASPSAVFAPRSFFLFAEYFPSRVSLLALISVFALLSFDFGDLEDARAIAIAAENLARYAWLGGRSTDLKVIDRSTHHSGPRESFSLPF